MPDAQASAERGSAPIGAILLAAGGSRRMGRPKQLLEFDGQALIRRAAEVAVAARLRPVVVVLGCETDACRRHLGDLVVDVIVNADWQRGIGASLRTGAAHLHAVAHVDAAIILLCDQPLVDAAAIERIVAAHRRRGAPVVAARYADTLGVPALFAGAWLERLLALPDDAGAKQLIREAGARAAAVDLPEAAFDLDSEEDVRRLRARGHAC